MPSTPQVVPTVVLFDYLLNDAGAALSGERVIVTLNAPSPITTISPLTVLTTTQQQTTTDGNGYWQFSLVPNGNISPANTVYTVQTPAGTYDITLGATGPYQSTALGTIVNVVVPLAPATTPGPVTVSGNLTVTGTLAGASETLSGTLGVTGLTTLTGGVNVAAGEPGIDTTAAGTLVFADNNATGVEMGSGSTLFNLQGDEVVRSVTVNATGSGASDFPGGVTNQVTSGDSAKVYDKGGTWVTLTGPKYRAIGTWDPVAGTGDCLAALNQAIIDGVPVLPPGTYNISGTPTNASNVAVIMLGTALLSGAGAAGWQAAAPNNIIRLGLPVSQAFSVASTGSDSNVGSAASPFLTLQHAVNVARQFAGSGDGVLIQVASGSYVGFVYSSNGLSFNSTGNNLAPQGITITGGVGGGTTTITKSSAPGCVTVLGYGASVVLAGTITFTSTGNALFVDDGGMITPNSTGITFGACTGAHMHSDRNSMIQIGAGYTISGNAPAHLETTLRGFIGYSEVGMTVTLTGSPVFSTAFAYCQAHGTMYVPSAFIVFSGAAGATTIRFLVKDNSLLMTNGGSATYIPGTAVGQLSNGGKYQPMPQPVITSLTGFGSTASSAFRAGSDDNQGQITITCAGAGFASTGSFILTFSTSGIDWPGSMSWTLGDGSTVWSPRAVLKLPFTGVNQVLPSIDNNAVAFVAGTLLIDYTRSPF